MYETHGQFLYYPYYSMGKTRRQQGGMPLSYVNPSYIEPSASSGSNLLHVQPGLARPVLNPTGGSRRKTLKKSKKSKKSRSRRLSKGGFIPSVMGPFLKNGAALLPAAAVSGYRFVRNYKGK